MYDDSDDDRRMNEQKARIMMAFGCELSIACMRGIDEPTG